MRSCFGSAVLLIVAVGPALAIQECPWYGDKERLFDCRLANTLENIRNILNETKSIQRADEQDHTYDDKYSLVEFATLNTWDSLWHGFSLLGLNLTEIAALVQASGVPIGSVSLNFRGTTDVDLVSKNEVDVKGVAVEETNSSEFTKTQRIIHRVTEYTWKVMKSYQLYLCLESCKEDKRDLQQREMSIEVKTSTYRYAKDPRVYAPSPVEIGWLLRRYSIDDKSFRFNIDRNADSCKTPRRNEDIESVLQFHGQLHTGVKMIDYYLRDMLVSYTQDGTDALLNDLFWAQEKGWHTALPLLENSTPLTAERVALLHANERQGLAEVLEEAAKQFVLAKPDAIVSTQEASLLIALRHLQMVLMMHEESVNFVESMLRRQLVQAIGKEIDAHDFRQYMQFHGKRLLAQEYVPHPFSVAVRHGNSTPVGSFSIQEQTRDGEQPIQLVSRRIAGGEGQPPIRIQIDAATHVEIIGDRILSGWIRYEFDEYPKHDMTTLEARARQFSSFILLVGTVTGPDSFDPKMAVILKNKDEVLIPILTESLPSAKEFKDAISSLSPEQQRFAKAFRAMQLESSVFGVCIIQLKPQLEKLLNLPAGSLTKEIQLTEDLTTLFVEYHVPSDLLSFDGEESMNTTAQVALVKQYVQSVNSVIQNAKEQVLQQEKEKSKARKFMQDNIQGSSTPVSSPSGMPSSSPSSMPSAAPSSMPSSAPSSMPSSAPSSIPSAAPSSMPSAAPSGMPSSAPSGMPSKTLAKDESPRAKTAEDMEDKPLSSLSTTALDFTKIPKNLDVKLEEHDTDGFLRSMIIKANINRWTFKVKANLLVDSELSVLDSHRIRDEKQKAVDLLDAISRSGNLPIDASELHVLIGVSHNFVNSVLRTVYMDNINPIEKAEKSLILLSSQILGKEPRELLQNKADLIRMAASFPDLF